MPAPEQGLREIDVRAGLNLFVTVSAYFLLAAFFDNAASCLNVCIAGITAVFLTETGFRKTLDAGITRLIITGIGVAAGVAVVFLDNLLGKNDIAAAVMTAVFGTAALVAAKRTKKVYVQCKLAIVSFLLTIFTFRGAGYAEMGLSGYRFALTWILSTVFAGVITCCVTWIFDLVVKSRKRVKTEH